MKCIQSLFPSTPWYAEEYEVAGGKGSTAHFVWRCGLCKRESSAKFETTAFKPYNSENAQFQPLLVIECRGLEFTDFDPRGIWKCIGTNSGTVFNEVDLTEREWNDYDEKASTLPWATYDLLCSTKCLS
ncbi:hypothetical protein CVT26_010351 [Gymnopilus dilepis]|uniref:Uncharacterized protein n=1 Tax=Gymnopilus dilepis TaxID=231916 RepID=A0A409W4T8_9AGAR|nr:hypothetical protein CVT26_010351 [Gymnopilus dilepis]